MLRARFSVHVQPRASKTQLVGLHAGAIKIRVAAAPVDDAANRALIEFIAEQLGVAKGCVRIVSGASGRRKIVEVDGVNQEAIRSWSSGASMPGLRR